MPSRRRNKGKQALRDSPSFEMEADVLEGPKESQLVLTSDKRRGIYECDYCHTDISQVPRIRCAVCPDFDLCLECFATTDHSMAIARLKAAATAYGTLQDNEKQTTLPGISVAAVNHVHTHGYRVADSTRYPLFPLARAMSQPSKSDLGDSIDAEAEESDNKEDNEEDAALEVEEKEESDRYAFAYEGDNMDVDEPEQRRTVHQPAEWTEVGTQESVSLKVVNEEKSDEIYIDAKTVVLQDDLKVMWTIEEDLRLLDSISSFGLGNWADISEAITGQGSIHKTPKRCMERYFDDFLGRYGHILPAFTIVGEAEDVEEEDVEEDERSDDGDEIRASMRRKSDRCPLVRSGSNLTSTSTCRRGKKRKVVPTASLPGYEDIWSNGYIPPIARAEHGLDVGRDTAMRAELAFVKELSSASTKEEADKIRKEWTETRLNQIGGPTALPMRQDDLPTLPGSELAGFMPRRGDFDMEWENEAEQVIADMEFSANDLPQDRQLKIQVIEIYNQKLDERELRKKFLVSRNLLDYRKNQQRDAQIPRDERDLILRMRLFERLHTPEEHEAFLGDILRAKRLRKEIAKLQMYRRMGIKTLVEVEMYELDKNRREFHKMAQLQKDGELKSALPTVTPKSSSSKETAPCASTASLHDDITSSLWKQYRTSDRKNRRSINRSILGSNADSETTPTSEIATREGRGDRFSLDAKDASEEADGTAEKGTNGTAEGDMNDKSDADMVEPGTDENPTEINTFPGFELLLSKEKELCRKLGLSPGHYLGVKTALIQESLRLGLLDRETVGSSKRSIVKIDVEKRGEVIDFMIRAGWISTKAGASAYQRHVISS